ncbi:uncharacterized protein LOC108109017 [Drosophila eugracilis]|uniref:uncharacterized protein LOC108109017 n=1 Tax=Drosophila eugracilis TaxID=29029 RepID=UPI0007E87088|nr:uncharacterized protein LOC108109017 [Drosophila eugracilis]
MGLKRFVSSLLRKAPIRSSEPGKLAAGCPAVFNEDGMWSAKFIMKKNGEQDMNSGHVVKHQSSRKDAELTPSSGLSRKRSWLQRRTISVS